METIKEVKQEKQTKKQILLNLMSKPMGVKVTTLVDNLGWKKHTTLGCISTLRKKGYHIQSIKGSKVIVYRMEKMEKMERSEPSKALVVVNNQLELNDEVEVENGSKEPMEAKV